MRASISVPGTFHAVELARQLHDRDGFRHLYTSHPAFLIETQPLPSETVTHVRHPEAVMQLGNRIPLVRRLPVVSWKNNLFDRAVARKLSPATGDEVFVGFAGSSLRSLRRANELGYTTIVERSSAHVRTQQEILEAEYDRLGMRPRTSPETAIEREEAEYDEADYVMTPSRFAFESFLDRGFDEDEVLRVPLGVDPTRYPPKERYDEEFTCLFVGHVGVRKGVRYLLSAWEDREFTDGRLTLTSDIEPAFEPHIGRYRSRSDTEFLGYVEDLAKTYRNASVFVFPSMEDGFARVVVEAMASGLPVVVSEHTGAKDCVRDGVDGFVVPAGDSEALREAIETLHDDPDLRREMGENARSHVCEEFTWGDYGERIHRTYGRICGPSPDP